MRLTLRTMLAYLDEILEPADGDEIGQKIEESEFANGLVHRIRGSMRRLRLPAPGLEGKGMGLDPNTVAEYLDNTLPSERVADFEKVCLESDVHLAEVAACHQVLTLVLGEPAQVENASRERIYRIVASSSTGASKLAIDGGHDSSDSSSQRSVASKSEKRGDESGNNSRRKKPEIPDYLRNPPRKKLVPIAITMLLAAGLTVAALRAIGPFDQNHPVLGSVLNDNSDEIVSGTVDDPPGLAPDVKLSSPPLPAESNYVADLNDQGDLYTTKVEQSQVDAESEQTADSEGEIVPPLASPVAPVTDLTETTLTAENDETGAAEAEEAVDPELVADAAENDETGAAEAEEAVDPELVADASDAFPETNNAADSQDPEVVEPEADIGLGRYTSEDQVLVRYDTETSDWIHLPPRSPLRAGDQLLVLPTYRPQILISGIHLTLGESTQIRLDSLDSETALIEIQYGRTLLFAPNRAGAQIGLILDGRRGSVTFTNVDSTLAVEVRREHSKGADPLNATAHTMVRVIATRGHIDWQPESGPPQTIEEQHELKFFDDDPGRLEPIKSLPPWTHRSVLNGVDRMASSTLISLLDADRSIGLRLSELTDHRRIEVCQLTTRCLGHMGRFDALVTGLNDVGQKTYWKYYFATLQKALARGPDTAAEVLGALERLRGTEALALFRMLRGYSPDDLENGGAQQLVEYLAHDKVDFRVLAFENLKDITQKSGSYQPWYTEKRRRPLVNRWIEDLKNGLIVYKSPPLSLPPRALVQPDQQPTEEDFDVDDSS